MKYKSLQLLRTQVPLQVKSFVQTWSELLDQAIVGIARNIDSKKMASMLAIILDLPNVFITG